jgi:serine/threonine protein kinase
VATSPRLDIFLTILLRSGNENFVFKRASRPFYELSQRLAAELAGTRRLRIHVDCNQEELILFYPYFRDTLLALIQDDPDLSLMERKKILRRVAEAIQELHSKDWIHLGTLSAIQNWYPNSLTIRAVLADVKPDNILVNWTCDKDGNKTVTDVTLGDFDIAFKSENGEPRQTPYAIGNVMWRSPEGQTGRGMTKASDMYSYGLVVS